MFLGLVFLFVVHLVKTTTAFGGWVASIRERSDQCMRSRSRLGSGTGVVRDGVPI